MARGFDSKDVESQIEQREAERRARNNPAPAGPDAGRAARRESLLLTRRRVESDLEAARHPRHRAQLEAALAFLDRQLAEIDQETRSPES